MMSRSRFERRLIALAALGTTTAAVLALTGCSTDGGATASDDQTITVAIDDPVPSQAVIDGFERMNPGVTVQVQDGGSAYQDFIRTGLATGSAPDVIRTFPGASNTAAVGVLDEAGALADLSDSAWVDELSETQKSLFGSEGKVLSVPIGALALGPIYSDQALEELGVEVPTTISEVMDLCTKAKAAGKVAYSLAQKGGSVLPTYSMVAPLIYGPNPNFTIEQIAGDQSFSSSAWTDAFEIQLDMNEAGCFNEGPNGTDTNAARQQIGQGAAIASFGFSDTSGFEEAAPEGTTFTLAPFPVTDDPDDLYLAVADSTGFGLNAEAKNPELAREFLAYLATSEAQNLYADASKGAPAIPNSDFEPANKNQQTIVDFQNAEHIGTWPDQGWPGASTGPVLADVSQTLFLGTDTPASAAEKLDEAFAADLESRE